MFKNTYTYIISQIKSATYIGSSKKNWFLIINLLIITFVLFFNFLNYFHELGYDAGAHKWYIEVLPLNLPTDQDTREFFSPPLPYIFPSLIDSVCDKLYELNYLNLDCTLLYGKVTQFFQIILFILTLFVFMKIADIIEPENYIYKSSLIFLVGLLNVNYKTFAMIRGEPYVLFFMILGIFYMARILYSEKEISYKNIFIIGIIFGLLALSRQWGFLFFPATAIFYILIFNKKNKQISIQYFKSFVFIFFIAFLISGWFYLRLYFEYGSFTAFNREPIPFKFSNQPKSFYFGLGLNNYELFNQPFRISFRNELFPILYSDLWGDYWGYFLYNFRYSNSFGFVYDNTLEMAKYTGRVNFVSLFPTLLYVTSFLGISFIMFKEYLHSKSNKSIFYIFISSAVIFIWIGYLFLLIKYPFLEDGRFNYKGDMIKATYVIHLFNLLPFFGAKLLITLRDRSQKTFIAIVLILVISYFHNIPASLTRFNGIIS